MKSTQNILLLLSILVSGICMGQNEVKIYAATAYQTKGFVFADKQLFESYDSGDGLFRTLNYNHTFGVNYTHFFNDKHGLSARVSYGIYDIKYKGDGIPLGGSPISTAYHTGEKLRLTGLFLNHHYRFGLRKKSRLSVDLSSGMGVWFQSVYEAQTKGSLNNVSSGGGVTVVGGSQEIDASPIATINGNLYAINLEPSLIWNLGRTRNGKGIDLGLGIPLHLVFHESANFNPKYTLGISTGIIFVL